MKLRELKFPVVADGKHRLRFDSLVVTDVDELEASETVALSQMAQPIFAGFAPDLSNDFSDWFHNYKSQITARISRLMLQEIARVRAAANWQLVDEWCQILLRHCPENEEAILAQSESLAMRGEKTAAVRSIDTYLSTIGATDVNLRVAASLLRRRITEKTSQDSFDVHTETALVGREYELKTLSEFLSRARARDTQITCVIGHAGIGKSRLVNEFAAFSALQGVSCHKISCRSSDAKRPLSAMLQLIPLLRSARGAIGSSPETLAFLEGLTTHRPEKSQRAPDDDGLSDPVYSKLDVALTDLLDAVCEEATTLVVIEDCHWMDLASAEALRGLLTKLDRQRVLFILTARPSKQDPLSDVHTIVLQPLDAFASATLIRTLAAARGKQVAESHVEWCVRIAEGNPYFLHELATHWLETGDQHVVPASLSLVLKQRLARLTPNALQVLQACCVLENNSTIESLEAVLRLPPHELLNGINELAMAGMLGSGSNRIESKHDLLSESALMQLAPQALSYLHRRAAVVLEGHIAQTADAATLWACAKHWQLAGDMAQALRLAESCAQHLLEAELPTEAVGAFARAIAYCGTEQDRLRILEAQTIACFQSSNWSEVVSVARDARQLRKRLNREADSHDDIELMLRRAEWQTRNWEQILAESLNCLQATDASDGHRMEAGGMALMLLSWKGDPEPPREVFRTMKDIASSTRTVRLDLWSQAQMIYNTCWGSIDEAVEAARRLVNEQRQQRNTVRLLRSLCNSAVTFRVAGKFQEASDNLQEAIAVAERQKIELFKGQAIPLLAHMAIDRGLTDQARQWLGLLRNLPTSADDAMMLAEIYSIDARLSLLDGRHVHARDLVVHRLAHLSSDPM
ncbi:MAG TPA: AAA family ATPase, partial [Gemmatimonadaceae bacterium]